MALILNIDTATETASVCLSENGHAVSYRENNVQKEHASFLHLAIESLMAEAGKGLSHVDAFAVTSGPGSYTGLRVGLATAKGFCYALQKPLIAINTLDVMAHAAQSKHPPSPRDAAMFYCPMIDARRAEVYTALYKRDLTTLLLPTAMVLNEHSFIDYLRNNSILFFGSGSEKTRQIITHKNAVFANIHHSAVDLGLLSHNYFVDRLFSDVVYTEPEYLKEFYSLVK